MLAVGAGGVVWIFLSFTCMNYVHGQDWHSRTVKNAKNRAGRLLCTVEIS